jgi:glycosyltransferase involved in cell wall biosynthesis
LKPFFSIIIPSYNSAGTISACLKSVAGQSFCNYEIIIMDGLSTDSSLQIINKFKDTYSSIGIRLYSEADDGIYDAMNKGIAKSNGSWLYFLGSDDTFYSPAVLSTIAEAIKTEPVDLIYGNVSGIDSKTRYVYDTVSKVLSKGIHHQSVFYHKTLFNSTGKYDTAFKVAADYHLTLKVFINSAFKTKYIDFEIANYGENGLSSATFDYTFFSYHYRFLAQNNALDKIDDRQKCLLTSFYCCFYLAKEKRNMGFAWRNILFYIKSSNGLGLRFRLKSLLRMIYWSVRPAI